MSGAGSGMGGGGNGPVKGGGMPADGAGGGGSSRSAASLVTDMLRKVDAFPKTHDEFRVRTSSGAAVSVCAIICMLLLFFSEFSLYLTTETTEFMEVDTSRHHQLLINFDITFPRMSCSVVHLDVMDAGGKHQLDVDHDVHKVRLDANGQRFGVREQNELKQTITSEEELLALAKAKNGTSGEAGSATKDEKAAGLESESGDPACGSCYGAGAPGQCCSTCAEVRELYRKKGWAFKPKEIGICQKQDVVSMLEEEEGEGCNMSGHLVVPRVAGNFHFAPGRSFQHAHNHVHDLMSFAVSKFNITHRINSLTFGDNYPDMENPLDGYGYNMTDSSGMYQYYLQVVPTQYTGTNGRTLDTNQYSATDHLRKLDSVSGRGLPGVFFFYDVSPIRVRMEATGRSFSTFLTECCAIIGGVFTVMGLVDKFVYHAVAAYRKRVSPLH